MWARRDSGSDIHSGIVVVGRDSGSDFHSGIARAEVVAEVTVIVEWEVVVFYSSATCRYTIPFSASDVEKHTKTTCMHVANAK